MKALVSKRAVMQRVNRRLRQDLLCLRATRGEALRAEVGDLHVLNCHTNRIVEKYVDLEERARELGALRPFEKMID